MINISEFNKSYFNDKMIVNNDEDILRIEYIRNATLRKNFILVLEIYLNNL